MRRAVAWNPATPAGLLAKLTGDAEASVRSEVAKSPATSPDLLVSLAGDADWWVRGTVAENPMTPIDTLAELARDAEAGVRRGVAWNPATPAGLLAKLKGDADRMVHWAVANNPATPANLRASLAIDTDLPALDYFISYTSADKAWAEWIGWVLEAGGASVRLQAWDFAPGSNFVLEMQKAAAEARRTIAVLSPDYVKSQFAAPEWAAAFADDPEGLTRKLVPVRVRNCDLKGMLRTVVHIDLVGLDQESAQKKLRDGLGAKRGKPDKAPPFPKLALAAGSSKPFPAVSTVSLSTPPHSLRDQSRVSFLEYNTATEAEATSASAVWSSGRPAQILYHHSVVKIWRLLDDYHNDPSPFLARLPAMERATKPDERDKIASGFYHNIHKNWDRASGVMKRNDQALSTVLEQLRAGLVSEELSGRSIRNFARFAALLLIKELKEFWDFREGAPVKFFEHFSFAQDPSWMIFDCGDSSNLTAKTALGFYFWVGALVGQRGDGHSRAILPIDIARKIDTEPVDSFDIYCEWLLPQIALIEPNYLAKVDPHNWKILSLQGRRKDGQSGMDGEWLDDHTRLFWG